MDLRAMDFCFVLLFFDSWGFSEFVRAHMARMWASGRERSRSTWSNSIRERPATGFPSAAFARV